MEPRFRRRVTITRFELAWRMLREPGEI